MSDSAEGNTEVVDLKNKPVWPFCEQLDLSSNDFIQAIEDGGAFLRLRRHQELVTNGLVLELLHLKEKEKLSFKDLTMWLKELSGKEV